MSLYENLRSYDGVLVVQFEHPHNGPPRDGREFGWALRTEYDGEAFDVIFERFLETVDPATVTRLVIGFWGEPGADAILAPLIAAAPRLPGLKALFFGDIISEEDEISWIKQGDLTPLLEAYPRLERLDVRGGDGLRLSPVSHAALRTLRFESGGLPAEVVRAVGASDLPKLETLDLWLGDPEYGGDATVADPGEILRGERLPALRHLGLMNSELQDEICAAVATAPVLARLSELDLSMGVLTDDGAEALLSGQPLTHLRALDLRHHYLTGSMAERVRKALPDTEVRIGKAEEGEPEHRFVAVSE